MTSTRPNYKEPPNLRIYKPRNPKITVAATVPSNCQETIYNEFQRHGLKLKFNDYVPNDDTEWYPTKVTAFVKYNRESAVEAEIETKEGSGKCVILETEWIREHYLAALASVSKDDLIKKKWISKNKYAKMLLPSSYKPKFSLRSEVWSTLIVHCNHSQNNCPCKPYQLVVHGKVVELCPHKFPLQQSPQFRFKANDPSLSGVADGWVVTAQLSKEKREWKYISISDIQLVEIRYLVSIGVTNSLQSPLITQIMPRDLLRESAYFGKTDLYFAQMPLLRSCLGSIDLVKMLAVKSLQNLVTKTYLLFPKSSSILTFSLKRRITVKNCLKFGDYMAESVFDVGFSYLLQQAKIPMICNDHVILIQIKVEKLSDLQVNNILKIETGGKKTELIGKISFAYHRKVSRVMIQKFSFNIKSTKRLKNEVRRIRERLRRRRKKSNK